MSCAARVRPAHELGSMCPRFPPDEQSVAEDEPRSNRPSSDRRSSSRAQAGVPGPADKTTAWDEPRPSGPAPDPRSLRQSRADAPGDAFAALIRSESRSGASGLEPSSDSAAATVWLSSTRNSGPASRQALTMPGHCATPGSGALDVVEVGGRCTRVGRLTSPLLPARSSTCRWWCPCARWSAPERAAE